MTTPSIPASSSVAPTTPSVAMPLSDADYRQLSHAVLSTVEATTDRWLDDDLVDIDTQRTGGLLEMSLPGGSKVIINTQPPLQEIWLAARSGGYHYRFNGERWVDTRDGREFFSVLSQALTEQAGLPLVITA